MTATEAYLLSVLRGRRGLLPSLLRGLAAGLALVHRVGLELYLLPYHLGIRKRFRLPVPVICVGNLTSGGTGKTPTTVRLCELLRAQAKKIVVLNRGYGGENEHGCAVVSDGQKVLLDAAQAGDEAFLLANSLSGVPVIVGKERRETGRLAVERFAPDVIVLDDGMQFWQLHRDLDIVLLNACAPFDNGWLLPRGLLREPPSHLRRAGIVVLTNARQAGAAQVERVRERAHRLAPKSPIFSGDFIPVSLRGMADNIEYSPDWLQGRHVAALSALGNPESFETLLTMLGGELVSRFRLPDHQAITPAQMADILVEAGAAGAEAVIITEKDAVKMTTMPDALPFYALAVEMRLDDEPVFFHAVSRAAFGDAGGQDEVSYQV